jgi:hypothetical protein
LSTTVQYIDCTVVYIPTSLYLTGNRVTLISFLLYPLYLSPFYYILKGTVSRTFRFFYLMTQFPPSPRVSHMDHLNFFKNSPRYSQVKVHHWCGIVDTGGKWKKSSIMKVLISFFGHLWEVELTYRYVYAFKFTLRSQQTALLQEPLEMKLSSGKVQAWE